MPAVELITRSYRGLSEGHRRIADFILASPHEAALMTQEKIADATGVSKATANRLGKRLGLSGYPELQQLLREELKEALRPIENLTETFRRPGAGGETPWAESIRQDLHLIGNIRTPGVDGAFAKASLALAEARRVFFVGFGSSAFIAQYGAFCMGTVREFADAIVDSSGIEGMQRKIMDAGPQDVAVQIAFARYSDHGARAGKQLRAQGVSMIAITDSENSPIAPLADIRFLVERKTGFVMSASGAGALSVVEALLRGTAASLGRDAVARRSARLTSSLGDSLLATPAVEDHETWIA
jgi:DNA-binding MurR/RpiR family transcriptional regulator